MAQTDEEIKLPSKFINVHSLSASKNNRYECVICKSDGAFLCTQCRACYCCREHLLLDDLACHSILCERQAAIREILKLPLATRNRPETANRLASLQDECRRVAYLESRRHVLEGNNELALPAAERSLHYARQVHGSNSIDLVPPLLALADVATLAGAKDAAMQYVSRARFLVQEKQQQLRVSCEKPLSKLIRTNLQNLEQIAPGTVILMGGRGDFRERRQRRDIPLPRRRGARLPHEQVLDEPDARSFSIAELLRRFARRGASAVLRDARVRSQQLADGASDLLGREARELQREVSGDLVGQRPRRGAEDLQERALAILFAADHLSRNHEGRTENVAELRLGAFEKAGLGIQQGGLDARGRQTLLPRRHQGGHPVCRLQYGPPRALLRSGKPRIQRVRPHHRHRPLLRRRYWQRRVGPLVPICPRQVPRGLPGRRRRQARASHTHLQVSLRVINFSLITSNLFLINLRLILKSIFEAIMIRTWLLISYLKSIKKLKPQNQVTSQFFFVTADTKTPSKTWFLLNFSGNIIIPRSWNI